MANLLFQGSTRASEHSGLRSVAQNTGIPKWVTLERGNMGTKTCGLLLLFHFEPHPAGIASTLCSRYKFLPGPGPLSMSVNPFAHVQMS